MNERSHIFTSAIMGPVALISLLSLIVLIFIEGLKGAIAILTPYFFIGFLLFIILSGGFLIKKTGTSKTLDLTIGFILVFVPACILSFLLIKGFGHG